MSDPVQAGRVPVRLDGQLVAELSAQPHLAHAAKMLHDLGDFLLKSAGADIGVAAPSDLHARGASSAAVAQSKLLFYHRLLVLRGAALVEDAVRSMNESRLVSFALATRALLETAAFAAYYIRRLAVPAEAAELPGDYHERLRAAVFASRFDWLKFFTDHATRIAMIDKYDADPGKQEPEVRAVSPMAALDALGERLKPLMPKARGIVHRDYAMLSDMCHPSAGGQMIFFAGPEPHLRASLVPHRATILMIAEQFLPCMAYSASVLVEVLAEIEELDEQLGKMQPAAAHPSPPKETGDA